MRQQKSSGKKGQSANYIIAILIALAAGALAYFVAGFLLSLSSNVTSTLGSSFEACGSTYTYNATANNCYLTSNASVKTPVQSVAVNLTQQTNQGFATMGSNMGLIAQVIIAVIVILLVMGLFFVFKGRGGGM